jgi:hypothetical protein
VGRYTLEPGKGTGQVRWTGLALGQVQLIWSVCNTCLTSRIEFNTLLEFDFLTSLLESFWVLSTLVLSRSPCCIPLYSTMTYTQERNKTHKNKLEHVNLIFPWAAFHLCLSLGASTWSWLEQLCLEPVRMELFDLYDQDVSSYPCHLDFSIQQISTLRIMWLYMTWLISQTQTFTCPFSITTGTSMPRLPLTLLRCMVHHGQALIDPSSITIMIHTTLCVFNELTLIIMINSFSSLKCVLSLWHSRCAIILSITYVLMNE